MHGLVTELLTHQCEDERLRDRLNRERDVDIADGVRAARHLNERDTEPVRVGLSEDRDIVGDRARPVPGIPLVRVRDQPVDARAIGHPARKGALLDVDRSSFEHGAPW